eukprot:1277656-Prorocentrum_lima.AAC.1
MVSLQVVDAQPIPMGELQVQGLRCPEVPCKPSKPVHIRFRLMTCRSSKRDCLEVVSIIGSEGPVHLA